MNVDFFVGITIILQHIHTAREVFYIVSFSIHRSTFFQFNPQTPFKLQACKFEWALCLFNRPWFRAGKIALLMPSPPRRSPSRRLIPVHEGGKVCTPIYDRRDRAPCCRPPPSDRSLDGDARVPCIGVVCQSAVLIDSPRERRACHRARKRARTPAIIMEGVARTCARVVGTPRR